MYEISEMDTPIALIAKGTFGAIVKVYGEDGDHHALKIQMVRASNQNNREYEISRDLQYLRAESLSPCVLNVRGCRRTNNLGQALHLVSRMKQVMSEEKAETHIYQLIEMDLIHGPNLREYMASHAFKDMPLSMEDLKGISFQLFWTTAMAQRTIEFKHRDLKPANIMLSPSRRHTYGLDGETWETRSKVPIPIDFNLSTSANNSSLKDWRCGTVSYMPPEKMYKIKKCATLEEFSHDPWSLGIILCSMALCGRSFKVTTPGLNRDEVFNPGKMETFYQLWLPHSTTFKQRFSHLLESHDWSTVKHAICLSLFQEALGNGPFPGDWPEFDKNVLCVELKRGWKGIKAILGTDNTLASMCPSIIMSQVGYDVFDLIKGLLEWNPRDRLTIDQVIKHRFFEELKVKHIIAKWGIQPTTFCASCGTPALHRCSRCQREYYCSTGCIKSDWDRHKHACEK
jgi:serine/threonine protein kinase